MLSFDENGWLFPDPLKNITHDIDSAEIDDLLKLAKEEDYWSAGIRETVKKRLEKDKDDVRLDWIVEDLMIKNTGGTVISMPFGKDIITFNSNRHFFRGENQQYLKSVPSLRRRQEGKSKYECELIKGIALMRSLQFAKFMIIPGLSEPPVRTLRAIYSGNSEPPYWALLHIFPLYCKDTPLV